MTPPHFVGIPLALRSVPQWLLWKNIISEQYPKGRKIPIDCNNMGSGSSTNPDSWGTFDDAQLMFESYPNRLSGVGFVLTKEAGVFCVDVDHCIVGGVLTPFAVDVLSIFDNKTYVEASFHRDGIHIFGKGNLPDGVKGGDRGGIEIYDSGRFIAITGYKMKSAYSDITDCQSELDQLCQKFPKAEKKPTGKPASTRSFNGGTITDKLGLTCTSIGYPDNAIKTAKGYQGAHPFHGSTTGGNYCINESDNTWFCFRHNSGGGALELYAISKGIIDCMDAGCGCLSDKWGEVFAALEKDGYRLDGVGLPGSIFRTRASTRAKLAAMGVL